MRGFLLFLRLMCFIVITTTPIHSHAQTITEQAIRQNTDIIQQEEQRRIQQSLQHNFKQDQQALINLPKIQNTSIPKNDMCINVNIIQLSGYSVFKTSDFIDILKSYEGRCLSLSQINDLVNEITNFYIDAGYVTSKTYIPAQDLSDGLLSLVIIEGELEKIEYKDGKRSEVNTTFPDRTGKVFNLRDIEQGLDQMNRLSSNRATMDILPGQQTGGSILHVKNSKTSPWNWNTGIDNLGTKSTGEWQASIGLSYDNLLHLSDNLRLNIKHDLDRTKRVGSRSASLNYDIPYGYWNFYYSLNYFDYVSEFTSGSFDFKNNGLSRTHEIGIKRVLHRNENGITRATLNMQAKQNENYLQDIRLDSSSRKLSIANLGLSQSYNIPNGFLYGSLTFSQGLRWLGAENDHENTPGGPKAQFQKMALDLRAIKQIDFGFGQYNPLFDMSGRYQYTPDLLFGTEQISAGGPYSVRGFKEESISGNTGGYIQTNLSIPIEIADIQPTIGTLRPFIGFDMGRINNYRTEGVFGGTVSSWSLGLKNENGIVDFQISFADSLHAPSHIDEKANEIYFSASLSF